MNNYNTQLFANGVRLDLFNDEVIKISNNVTGLFDIDKLPSDFTRQITIPGTKTNNAFFDHFYDIDVSKPFLFSQEKKVTCFLDVSSYLLVQGFLQLNSVNVINNLVNSYDVTLFGSISNLSTDLRKNNLTDITGLSVYNHTSSYDNIYFSWDGDLFNGDIVYPLIDYGKGYQFSSASPTDGFGIDNAERGVYVKDFKPAIRAKKVVDKIFEEFNYTYSSSFFDEPMWDNIYMVCNYGGQFPQYDDLDISIEGMVKVRLTSGSTTDVTLTENYQQIFFDTIESDPSYAMSGGNIYNKPVNGPIRGKIKLNLSITGTGAGTLGFPRIDFGLAGPNWPGDINDFSPIPLTEINEFLQQTYSQLDKVGEKTYTVEQDYYKLSVNAEPKRFIIRKVNTGGSGDFTVILAKDGDTKSYFSVEELGTIADNKIMNIPINMPFGETGITCLDFIKGLQKKFNLIIQPSKTFLNHFEIETFNYWYSDGNIIDFTRFIDESKPITTTPANVLAVNELVFSDKEGSDFLSSDFKNKNNRTFGKSFFIDNQNQFSQGKLDITTEFASSPLRYINGSGDTGIGSLPSKPQSSLIQIFYSNSLGSLCANSGTQRAVYLAGSGLSSLNVDDVLYIDEYLTTPFTGQTYVVELFQTDIYVLISSTGRIIGQVNCEGDIV